VPRELDRVVGFELPDRLLFEFFEDFLADGIVDLVQRGEVEVGSGQFHQADAVVGLERGDQVAEVGLLQLGNYSAQNRRVAGFDRASDAFDEFAMDLAILSARFNMMELGR
jgi:hypothetical protein